jgi:hypothetical protein
MDDLKASLLCRNDESAGSSDRSSSLDWSVLLRFSLLEVTASSAARFRESASCFSYRLAYMERGSMVGAVWYGFRVEGDKYFWI